MSRSDENSALLLIPSANADAQEKSFFQQHKYKVVAGTLTLTGLAAFLLFEHFKKSSGIAPTFAPDITSTFPPTTTATPPLTYAPGGGSVPYFSISQYLNGTSPRDLYKTQLLMPVPLSDFVDNTSWTVSLLHTWFVASSFLLTYSFNGSMPTNMCLMYMLWCAPLNRSSNASCNDAIWQPLNVTTVCAGESLSPTDIACIYFLVAQLKATCIAMQVMALQMLKNASQVCAAVANEGGWMSYPGISATQQFMLIAGSGDNASYVVKKGCLGGKRTNCDITLTITCPDSFFARSLAYAKRAGSFATSAAAHAAGSAAGWLEAQKQMHGL